MLRDLLPGSSTSPEMREIGATMRLSSLVAGAGAPIITCTCHAHKKNAVETPELPSFSASPWEWPKTT